MFCMNCGHQLPEGAKFCLNCGTPQGAVSPTGTTQAESINLDGTHTFVTAICPNCNSHMKVDTSSKVAHYEANGTECLVQDAIKTLSVRGNVQVGNATINVSGTNTDSLLQRVEIMLADGDFSLVVSQCIFILNLEPNNGKAYFYKLMADLKCRNRNELANQQIPFDRNKFYIRAIQYGDESLKSELWGYINTIQARTYEKIKNPSIGDVVCFGIYNGQRMYWKVLDIQDRMALIITTDCICTKPYHQPGGDITWSECTLRQWLNKEFIDGSFTLVERNRILLGRIRNDDNPHFKTKGGGPTNDKVFLLSNSQAEYYFKNDSEIKCSGDGWLRSPGGSSDKAACTDYDGLVSYRGVFVGYYDVGVRPALWLNLES